jgi:hypothetical protein
MWSSSPFFLNFLSPFLKKVNWQATEVTNVVIDLLRVSNTVQVVGSILPFPNFVSNTGSYNWTIPTVGDAQILMLQIIT